MSITTAAALALGSVLAGGVGSGIAASKKRKSEQERLAFEKSKITPSGFADFGEELVGDEASALAQAKRPLNLSLAPDRQMSPEEIRRILTLARG